MAYDILSMFLILVVIPPLAAKCSYLKYRHTPVCNRLNRKHFVK